MKHEDCTETDISASDVLGDATDEDGHATSSNRNYKGKVLFLRHFKGAKHHGLDLLVPPEERYERIMSYRFYRLTNISATRTSASTTRLHCTLKHLELKVKDFTFSGEDRILNFYFLSILGEEAGTLNMAKGQLMGFTSAHVDQNHGKKISLDFKSKSCWWSFLLARSRPMFLTHVCDRILNS